MKKLIIIGVVLILCIGVFFLTSSLSSGKDSNFINMGDELKKLNYKLQEELPGQKGPNDRFKSVKIYKVNNTETVSLYEYKSYNSAKNDLERLAGPFIDWATTPHIFHEGRYIIIYVGKNTKLISDLEKILGKHYISEYTAEI